MKLINLVMVAYINILRMEIQSKQKGYFHLENVKTKLPHRIFSSSINKCGLYPKREIVARQWLPQRLPPHFSKTSIPNTLKSIINATFWHSMINYYLEISWRLASQLYKYIITILKYTTLIHIFMSLLIER